MSTGIPVDPPLDLSANTGYIFDTAQARLVRKVIGGRCLSAAPTAPLAPPLSSWPGEPFPPKEKPPFGGQVATGHDRVKITGVIMAKLSLLSIAQFDILAKTC